MAVAAASPAEVQTGTPTWDILVASIAHRTVMLTELLGELSRQLVPGVGVHVCRDNLQLNIGEKRSRLLASSTAEYIAFVDDDDMINLRYVELVTKALQSRPDYVGCKVRWTEDGQAQRPVYHSLTHRGWFHTPLGLYRDISHLNPIRRELAVRGTWSGDYAEDRRWAKSLRKQRCLKTEVWIDEELYWYRHKPQDGFPGSAAQAPLDEIPPLPDAPFVTWVN